MNEGKAAGFAALFIQWIYRAELAQTYLLYASTFLLAKAFANASAS